MGKMSSHHVSEEQNVLKRRDVKKMCGANQQRVLGLSHSETTNQRDFEDERAARKVCTIIISAVHIMRIGSRYWNA